MEAIYPSLPRHKSGNHRLLDVQRRDVLEQRCSGKKRFVRAQITENRISGCLNIGAFISGKQRGKNAAPKEIGLGALEFARATGEHLNALILGQSRKVGQQGRLADARFTRYGDNVSAAVAKIAEVL